MIIKKTTTDLPRRTIYLNTSLTNPNYIVIRNPEFIQPQMPFSDRYISGTCANSRTLTSFDMELENGDYVARHNVIILGY